MTPTLSRKSRLFQTLQHYSGIFAEELYDLKAGNEVLKDRYYVDDAGDDANDEFRLQLCSQVMQLNEGPDLSSLCLI